MPSREDDVRLLVLCVGDPESAINFSGSARSLIQALERRGIVHRKLNVEGPVSRLIRHRGRIVGTLRRLDRLHLGNRWLWSRSALAWNARLAERLAGRHGGFNACLLYGTQLEAPRLDVPTYCYFDATAAQLYRARAFSFGSMPAHTATEAIAAQARVFSRCAAVFPRSEWAARSVREDYGVAPARVCVPHAGPNHDLRPLPHAPYDRRTILFVGRDFERKGGPLLLEAFRRVRRTLPDARLVIVGAAPRVDDPGVEVIGELSKDDPPGLERMLRLYADASVFCLMSHYEPFGISVVEAQHAGVPCVVPARFAFTETVVDGVTGRHVAEYEPGLLADALLDLLGDPRRLEAMGRAAQEHARRNYTWEAAAERIHARIRADLNGLAAEGTQRAA